MDVCCRVLRTFQTKEAAIAKLFAKHIKLREAVEYVKKTRYFTSSSLSTLEVLLLTFQGWDLGLVLLLVSSTFSKQVCCTSFILLQHDNFLWVTVLISVGALSLSDLEQVVVDCSHIDQKKRGIFDMRETLQPLMALLNKSELKSRYGNGSGKVRLLLY